MAAGDEYVVRMPGPWDGPLRVVERTPTAFRFATLEGHLEAGPVQLHGAGRAARVPHRVLGAGRRPAFELSHHLRMSKEVSSSSMSTSMLERVAELSARRP